MSRPKRGDRIRWDQLHQLGAGSAVYLKDTGLTYSFLNDTELGFPLGWYAAGHTGWINMQLEAGERKFRVLISRPCSR